MKPRECCNGECNQGRTCPERHYTVGRIEYAGWGVVGVAVLLALLASVEIGDALAHLIIVAK